MIKLIETVRVDRLLTLSTNIHVIYVYFNTNMELIINLKAYYYGNYNYRLASNIIFINMNHWFYDGAVFFQCVG